MKTDLRREIASYSARAGRVDVVQVPPLLHLAVDGHGDPNSSPAYAEAVAALYPLAYGIKRQGQESDRDHVVMPLEALWWSADMAAFTTARDKTRWDWTLLIMVPAWVTEEHLRAARTAAGRRNPAAALDRVRLERLDEGLCVQTLHVGPYDAEGPVLEELHDRFIPQHGLRMTGRHHEIYLSDPRRTAPPRLRTILRQPVERV